MVAQPCEDMHSGTSSWFTLMYIKFLSEHKWFKTTPRHGWVHGSSSWKKDKIRADVDKIAKKSFGSNLMGSLTAKIYSDKYSYAFSSLRNVCIPVKIMLNLRCQVTVGCSENTCVQFDMIVPTSRGIKRQTKYVFR